MPALVVNCLLPAISCEKCAEFVPAMIRFEEELGIDNETASLPASSCKKHAELVPAMIQLEEELGIDNESAPLPASS